ncbi:MAG: peroxiredoxin [Bryobacteraceae bacterium]
MKLSKSVATLLAPAFVAITALTALPAAYGTGIPAVGNKAPTFILDSQEGTPVSLKDFRGKWVVLYFYPKDMSKGCTVEAHNFEHDLAIFQRKNAVVVGVSVDTVSSHQEFCTKDSLTFKLLADPSHRVTNLYGSLGSYNGTALAERHTFLIDPQGVIRKVYLKVNPNFHSRKVLMALADFQKGSGQ